jgi:hypothetical protein
VEEIKKTLLIWIKTFTVYDFLKIYFSFASNRKIKTYRVFLLAFFSSISYTLCLKLI